MSQLNVNTINERTSASGVTIDGVLIKDNKLASGTGNVLQVVAATESTGVTTTSQSYQDTGLSASITPSATSSKILVIVSQNIRVHRNNYSDITGVVQLLRDSTAIMHRDVMIRGSSGQNSVTTDGGMVILDTPSTTSSITYKTQILVSTSDSGGYAQAGHGDSEEHIILMEIGG